jgi:HEAT repeat protein
MSLESYLEELADPDQPVHASNLAHLSNLPAPGIKALEDVWSRLSDERREEVVRGLVEIAEDNVELNFDAVFMIALGDLNANVRREAVRGLWEYDGAGLVSRLIEILEHDEDAGVRAEAALGLGRFAMKAEFNELTAVNGKNVDVALRRAFEDEREPVEVRARAIESLGARSEPWVAELIEEAYDSEERPLHLAAVHAMGRSADARWLGTLEEEGESEDAEMRFEVATAAGAIGDEDAIPLLVELARDEDGEVQEAAIGALGEIGGSPAKEALRELMDDATESVREAALAALREADFADDPLGVRVIE